MALYTNFHEAVSDLRARGFLTTFSIQHDELFCSELGKPVSPQDVKLLESHRVDDPQNITGKREVFGLETSECRGIMTDINAEYFPKQFNEMFGQFRK